MACDRQFTTNGVVAWKGPTKIYKFKAHPDTYAACDYIMGFAGNADGMMQAIDFFHNPDSYKQCPKLNNMTGIVLTAQGDIFTYDNPQRWMAVSDDYFSIGSGSIFALGALAAGADLKTAIKIASERDPYTGMGIKILTW